MELPAGVEDLTPSWFSKMLGGIKVKPETFKLVSNIQEGLGMMSMMVRVEFEVHVPENSPDARSKYNLIVKLLPEQSETVYAEARETVIDSKLDQIEIAVYKYFLPDLIQEVPDLQKHVCGMLFGEYREADAVAKTSHASILVLEDLCALGYTTKRWTETLSSSEYNQGIEFLAFFHTACKALEFRRGAKLPDIYPWFPNWISDMDAIRRGQLPKLFSYVKDGLEPICKFLEDQAKPHLIPPYKILTQKVDQVMQAITIAANNYPSGTHLDLHSQNMLVHSDPEKPVQVIDWQVIGYTDPMFDLAYYVLVTSPETALNRADICTALQSYFNKCTELSARKGLSLDRSYEELEKFYLTYGFGFALAWYSFGFPAALEMPGCSKAKLLRCLELFDELGVPDFLLSIV